MIYTNFIRYMFTKERSHGSRHSSFIYDICYLEFLLHDDFLASDDIDAGSEGVDIALSGILFNKNAVHS